MTKPKTKPATSSDAVRAALEREEAKRPEGLKPIEIVKVAISAFQAYEYARGNASNAAVGERKSLTRSTLVESDDRIGLRRGTQASIDRLLFNVNYWRGAYEDRIVAACTSAEDARACLNAICAWNSHTMKLNTLPPEEVVATFERFCPPLATNNRRGSQAAGRGKGPVHDFKACALAIAERETPEHAAALRGIVTDVENEAACYAALSQETPLDALMDLLPVWCLQDAIDLVHGTWWDDIDIIELLVDELQVRFLALGYGEALCTYFTDSLHESLDEYQRTISEVDDTFTHTSVPQLLEQVRSARQEHPDFETDGYGASLPAWLSAKEQLIWNIVVCAIYGPLYTRPLLAEGVGYLPTNGKPASSDVITELAQRAYSDYLAARRASGIAPEYGAFELQPDSLRNSGLERIESIPEKLEILGYRIVPAGSCYPEQRVLAFTPSEVECLAVLEHRRWLAERTLAGWTYSEEKDVTAKQSPYLVIWEELPDRAREWNRSSIREIPTLLASVGLAIVH